MPCAMISWIWMATNIYMRYLDLFLLLPWLLIVSSLVWNSGVNCVTAPQCLIDFQFSLFNFYQIQVVCSGRRRGLLWTELVSLANSHCMGHLGISGEESSAQCFNLSFMGLLDQSAKSVIKFIWFPSACLNLPVPQSRTSMYFYCPMCMK
jgi:hypothetical protein